MEDEKLQKLVHHASQFFHDEMYACAEKMCDTDKEKIFFLANTVINLAGNICFSLTKDDEGLEPYRLHTEEFIDSLTKWFEGALINKKLQLEKESH